CLRSRRRATPAMPRTCYLIARCRANGSNWFIRASCDRVSVLLRGVSSAMNNWHIRDAGDGTRSVLLRTKTIPALAIHEGAVLPDLIVSPSFPVQKDANLCRCDT